MVETPTSATPSAAPRDGDDTTAEHRPPVGASATRRWSAPDGGDLEYTVTAGWTLLRAEDRPTAEVFSCAYVVAPAADATAPRPVTFVFNGGPGASSCFLHVGALGPRRVAFPADGTQPRPPYRLVDNADSWLSFTDLVFVDPVGTGFSRVVPPKPAKGKDGEEQPAPAAAEADAGTKAPEFFGVTGDLESLGQFITRWLSATGRWTSPVFLAGESYGGFRAAALPRLLHETFGVGLSGTVMISPALEFAALDTSDYDAMYWVHLLPTLAAAAHHHGRGRVLPATASVSDVLTAAEDFATSDYATLLLLGRRMDADRRAALLARTADFIGLPLDLVTRCGGRIDMDRYARELLRDRSTVVGWYDASLTAADPFPDRETFEGGDPTLAGIDPPFTAATNHLLRTEIGVTTDRHYLTISETVNRAWKHDPDMHALESQVGATDDLRYAMALNPHLRGFLCHGTLDMVTPYFSSERVVDAVDLGPSAERLTVRKYQGGHMFYTWQASREAFRADVAAFFADCLD